MTGFRNANSKILEPFTHDRRIRFLQRKTQFRNQLSKHSENNPHCEWCSQNLDTSAKENLLHACFTCPKLQNKPREIANLLGIGHLISDPIEAKEVLIATTSYNKNINIICNAVWMIYTRIILGLKDANICLNTSDAAKKIIYEITGVNRMFPNRPLAIAVKELGLMEFYASHYPGHDNLLM